MINQAIPSQTANWSLKGVIARLAAQPSVQSVLIIGSLRHNELTDDSDFDVVIVLDNLPQAWFVGVTQIDHRFTDLIFVNHTEIEHIHQLDAPVANKHPLVPIIRWLQDGALQFNRSPILEEVQAKVQTQPWVLSIDDTAVYEAWFSINYNLAQARRMAASHNSLYQQVAAIRTAVYGHSDIWFGYFTMRKLAWAGDKTAVSYLQTHDPEFLAAYQQFITTTNLQDKMKAYETAAIIATAPQGGLWPENAAVMNVMDTHSLWQQLIREDVSS
ncbi:MAG: hypothetical protein KC421_30165 [Anaerolineales bacterium]|nr:hypothetical protein [Anaerolineales bacterium]